MLTHLELSSRAELIHVILWHLSHFQQSDIAIVVDDGSTFDIRLGLVRDFHHVLCLRVDHGLEDVEIDHSTEIVDIGDEDVFLSSSDELVEQARVSRSNLSTGITRVRLALTSGHQRYRRGLVDTSWTCHLWLLQRKEAMTPCRLEGIEIG